MPDELSAHSPSPSPGVLLAQAVVASLQTASIGRDHPIGGQAISAAVLRHTVSFQALDGDVQVEALKAIENDEAWARLDSVERCVAACSLVLGDALLLPEDLTVDLQQAAQAALARREAFAALRPAAQEQVLRALVNAGITHGLRLAGQPGQDRELACYAQCFGLALSDALLLPEDGPVDLQRAAQAALARRETLAALQPAAQEQVLTALVNAGVTHGKRLAGPPGQDRALACYAQCCSLALSDALLLPEHGPVDVQQAAHAALARRETFVALQPAAQKQVLKAMVNAGVTHRQRLAGRPGQDRALACYAQSCSLALGDALLLPEDGPVDFQHAAQAALARREAFAALQPAAQEQVLQALGNAGVTHRQRLAGSPGQDRALACYAQCCSLALGDALLLPEDGPVDLQRAAQAALARREAFAALQPADQEQVLKALFNAGITHGLRLAGSPGQDRELACYAQCCSLALGDALLLPEDGPVDLQQAAQAALSRRNAFAALHPNVQGPVLSALVNAGVTHRQHLAGRPGQDRALACYAQSCSLALGDALLLPEDGPVDLQQAAQAALARRETFVVLPPAAQEQVLTALFNAGFTYGLRLTGQPGQAQELACYAQCCSLALGDALLLPEDGPVDVQQAAQAALARREAFAALQPTAQELVLRALVNAIDLPNIDATRPVLWALAMALLPRDVGTARICLEGLNSMLPSARHGPQSASAATTWLTRMGALPSNPQHPGQTVVVLDLADRALALQRRVEQPLGRWLQSVIGANGQVPRDLWTRVSRAQGWPVQFIELPHWLAALGLAGGVIDVAQLKTTGMGATHVQVLAERGGWLRCLDADGSARRSHILDKLQAPSFTAFTLDASRWQLNEADHPRWKEWLLTISKGAPLEDIAYAFVAWWQKLLPTIEDMFAWRQSWLPDESPDSAWLSSVFAAVLAQSDHFVQQVWQKACAGLPSEPKALLLGTADVASCGTSANLQLCWLRQGHSSMTDRLLMTQQYWAEQLIALSDDASQLWRLLELSRHSLLTAKPGSLRWQDWDKVALDALAEADRRALRDAEARISAQAQGMPEPPNCLNADRPIEPFATMAQQWERMGVGLEVPSAQAVAQCLAPHEALIQPWWDADGQGYALLLQPGHAVRRLSMPPELHSPSWQMVARLWQKVARLDAQDGCKDYDLDAAFARAWQVMVAPASVAVATWHWLREHAGPACTNLILVWPADKAGLPWQALVESIEPEDCGATMELAVSAAALLKSRTPVASSSQTDRDAQVATHAALFVDDLWRSTLTDHQTATRIEASVLPYALRQQARRSADAACFLQALACNGMVHLAAHGVYDETQPLASHLVLHDAAAMRREAQDDELTRRRARRRFMGPVSSDAAPTDSARAATTTAQILAEQRHALPAWLLSQMRLAQPEISLSACQALRMGVGEDVGAALRGPAGLGAVLSAAGARSVVGSLWACSSLGIALFYERWFHHRQQHDALRALRRARQDLRTMSWDNYEQWIERWLKHARDEGLLDEAAHAELQRQALKHLQQKQDSILYSGRSSGPFDHPTDWCGLCLVGNAPPRSDAQWQAPASASSAASWWTRVLQRLGFGSRGR